MQIIVLILTYLGLMQSGDDINDAKIHKKLKKEIAEIKSQVSTTSSAATIANTSSASSITVTVDGTPVIIDIQQF